MTTVAYYSKIIEHKNISNSDLIEIIRIKSAAWPFSFESQAKWIESKIRSFDMHYILYDDFKPVGYLNLIPINITINNTQIRALGIGNVCSIEKGKGFGAALMNSLNSYLHMVDTVGILFCKTGLVNFYEKFNWLLINRQISFNRTEINDINIMTYNFKKPINSIFYYEDIF